MAILLVDLTKKLESVILPSGSESRVVKINGAVTQLRRQFMESGDEMLLWEIVGFLLPDATKEEVMLLDIAQCEAVVQIASGHADKIEAEILAAAKKKRESEGNQTATAKQKPKARRRVTGSAS